MKDQNKQDEYERTFNLSGSNPQNKYVSLDHILFQIEQFRRGCVFAENRSLLNDLKQYLIEQNDPFIDGNINEDD